MDITKIGEHIHRLTIPYKDIFTTVYAIETPEGALLFDAASSDEDVDGYILPFLQELQIDKEAVKYVFISHAHRDHADGLPRLMQHCPKTCIITGSPQLKEKYAQYDVMLSKEGDMVLGVLQLIAVPGHTADSGCVYDTRTKTLVTGDSMQLYGIFGSGAWGANINLVKEHMQAIDKLRAMDIEEVLTAHDYHPYGYHYTGKEAVFKALDACLLPLEEVRQLVLENPTLNDAQISDLYNCKEKPTLGAHVVTAVRATM